MLLVSREQNIKDQRDHTGWNQGWEPRNPTPKSGRWAKRCGELPQPPRIWLPASSDLELPWKLLEPQSGVIVVSSHWRISLTWIFLGASWSPVFSATTHPYCSRVSQFTYTWCKEPIHFVFSWLFLNSLIWCPLVALPGQTWAFITPLPFL